MSGELAGRHSFGSAQRRPDVLAAEHQLVCRKRRYRRGAGRFLSEYCPDGQLRHGEHSAFRAVQAGIRRLVVLAADHLPIFAGGANVANLDLSKIEKNIFIAQYEKSLQTAFREVDDALARASTLDEQLSAQRAVLDDASKSYQLADMRFRSGVDSFLPVLDAQRSLYSAQQAVVSLELLRLQNMATLYKALGGGMKEDSMRTDLAIRGSVCNPAADRARNRGGF